MDAVGQTSEPLESIVKERPQRLGKNETLWIRFSGEFETVEGLVSELRGLLTQIVNARQLHPQEEQHRGGDAFGFTLVAKWAKSSEQDTNDGH